MTNCHYYKIHQHTVAIGVKLQTPSMHTYTCAKLDWYSAYVNSQTDCYKHYGTITNN